MVQNRWSDREANLSGPDRRSPFDSAKDVVVACLCRRCPDHPIEFGKIEPHLDIPGWQMVTGSVHGEKLRNDRG